MATRSRTRAILQWVVASSVVLSACSESKFPATPTPIAATPVTTLQGARYEGVVVTASGAVTPFNMTLIARGLGQTAAQAPGTILVGGNFETGTGVQGTVDGSLNGTLENGTFTGTLSVLTSGCTERRMYTGFITGSGVAMVAGDRVQSCPVNVLTFSIQLSRQGGPSCTFSISPTSGLASGAGDTGAVNVSAGANCAWVSQSLVSWMSITSAPAGVGGGSITFAVQPNSGATREGALRVAGQTFTITQGPPCSYSLSAKGAIVSSGGATLGVFLTASDAACIWTATTSESWIAVSPASGRGSATIQIVVQPNTGSQRQGIVTIAGLTFTVIQQAAADRLNSLWPPSASVSSLGGEYDRQPTLRERHYWRARLHADAEQIMRRVSALPWPQ